MGFEPVESESKLHVQNIFDALNPLGGGVIGQSKLRCLQLHNRAVSLADSGDIIAIGAECDPQFVSYMLGITGAANVLTLRYRVNPRPEVYLNAGSVFEELKADPDWDSAMRRNPTLYPYMKSASVYESALGAGMAIPKFDRRIAITDNLSDRMNDKALFYRECSAMDIPIPKYWVVGQGDLASTTVELLENGYGPLYIRPTKSGGTVGNFAIDRSNSTFHMLESGTQFHGVDQTVQAIAKLSESGIWNEYLISELWELAASPATLFHADDETVRIISHTTQILDTSRSFNGFAYPIENEAFRRHFDTVEEALTKLIEPWRRRGYRGFGNIDWMVTQKGEFAMAERNARQTSTVTPLVIADKALRGNSKIERTEAPDISILTQDALTIDGGATFDAVVEKLRGHDLLFGQRGRTDGVIITTPPSSQSGIRTFGLMVLGDDSYSSFDFYKKVLSAFGLEQAGPVFEHFSG